MCGQIAGLIQEIKPVREVIAEIMSGFEATIFRLQSVVETR
jgi:NAD(P)H-dependent flavin oxidoreductase YrpB (nitropropane dioxygenase family)